MEFNFCCVLLILGLLASTATAQLQECPTLSPGSSGACVEACRSDSECNDGHLCCSNGCGHDCTPAVDPCDAVRCATPNCTELSAGTIIPEGECCPVCDDGGTGVTAIVNLMILVMCGLLVFLFS